MDVGELNSDKEVEVSIVVVLNVDERTREIVTYEVEIFEVPWAS